MAEDQAKYWTIFEALQKAIRDGAYPAGRPLPSESALMRKFGVSRITAVRAMEELRKSGLVYRKRGAGTFATRAARLESGRLGLIMPSLAFGEIFPSVCQSLTRSAQKDGYSFVLGDISGSTPEKRAREACDVARMFVEQRVSGVVFQPLAFLRTPERITREILALFAAEEIPVVLIDRDVEMRVLPHDFVGIDNFNAGRALGIHVRGTGAKRVRFLMRPQCASIIRDRVDGVRSVCETLATIVAEPTDKSALAAVFKKRARPDAVICESDFVAAQLVSTLGKLGLSVPGDVLVAGFDDMRFAESLSLTTIHQPCADLARIAYSTLRERMRDPGLPARRILLPADLVVRDSTRRVK